MVRSVTTICPRSGRIGASSPTIGASRMLALPAASATLPATTSPWLVCRWNSPPLLLIAETGRSGK